MGKEEKEPGFRDLVHEDMERAVGGFDDHNTRVEAILIVSSGRDFRQSEEEVDVAVHQKVGVDENNLQQTIVSD